MKYFSTLDTIYKICYLLINIKIFRRFQMKRYILTQTMIGGALESI